MVCLKNELTASSKKARKRRVFNRKLKPKIENFCRAKIELSRGEICVANFIPPANGVSFGKLFC